MAKKRPHAELKAGALKAAIWENETADGMRYGVTIARLYRDTDGSWKSTTSLNSSDTGNLALLALKLDDYFRSLRKTSETSQNDEQ